MQPIPGGAAARPFVTHHNALDMDMYLRIAPELYLKRLVVGGFERVYEINRNFRNEGLSTRHNPEFTMLELYLAYGDYRDLMDWVREGAARPGAMRSTAPRELDYQGRTYDLAQALPPRDGGAGDHRAQSGHRSALAARSRPACASACEQLGIPCSDRRRRRASCRSRSSRRPSSSTLIEPTFVYAYPVEVSPLSRANDADPFITDRFEFFIAGREIANGFSELNDPEDQAARFRAQVGAQGQGRRGGHVLRRRLRPRAGVRHAADRRAAASASTAW